MVRHKICGTLALVVGLESLAPACWAQGPDKLGDSFRHLQKFARDAEQATSMPAPAERPEARKTSADEGLDLRGHIRLVDEWGTGRKILGKSETEFLQFVAALVVANDDRDYATDLVITEGQSEHPSMSIDKDHYPPVRQLRIPARALIAAQNLDELAAIIIRSIGKALPHVFAHRDDPRIMRRLEEQVGFASLPKDVTRMILTDISVIERLRGAGYRPWALTDFDRREIDYDENRGQMYEVRLLAQKIAVGYMQDRENIKDLLRTVHPLPPGFRKVRLRAMRANPLRYAWYLTKKYRRWIVGGIAVGALVGAAQVPFVTQRASHLWQPDFVVALLKFLGHAGWTALAFVGSVLKFVGMTFVHGVGYLFHAVAAAAGFLYAWWIHPWWEYVMAPVLGAFRDVLKFVVADVLAPVVKWTAHQLWDWIYVVLGLATAAFVYLVAPGVWGAVKGFSRGLWEFGGAIGEAFGEYKNVARRALVGELNRVLLHDVFPRQVYPNHPGLSEVELLSRAALDLELLRDVKRRGKLVSDEFHPRDLMVLGHVYSAPQDYGTLAKQFLRAFHQAVAAGRLRPNEVVHIGRPLLRDQSSETAFDSVLGDFFRTKHGRASVAAFHRTLRATYPGAKDVLEGSHIWSPRISEINDTGLPNAAFLGLTRIAAEMEDARREPNIDQLRGLWYFLHGRYQHGELIDDIIRGSFPYVTEKIFSGEWSREQADLAYDLWSEVRSAPRRDQLSDHWDQWSTLPGRLADLRGRALWNRELGRAVAITTWESTTKRRQSVLQLNAKFDRLSNAGVRNLTHAATDLWLQRHLVALGSVRAIVDWIEHDVLDRGARVDTLTPVLFHIVVEHPELIRDMGDVDALIAKDYFWPLGPLPVGGLFARLRNAIRERFLGHGPLDDELHEALLESRRRGNVHYQTNLCEKMHHAIVERMKALGLRPRDYRGLQQFWLKLTDRATTSETDRLVQELIDLASPGDLAVLRQQAISERRVWERDLHSRLALVQARSQRNYQELLTLPVGHALRQARLDEVIADLQRDLPERGLAYVRFLEDLSVRIDSTYDEAKQISVAKGEVADQTVADSNLAAVREVFRNICKWSKAEQFNFLKFLRGDAVPSPRLVAAFPSVGLERVARMFEILPLGARVGVLDSLLTHGILKIGDDNDQWTRTLSQHIVGGQKTEAQKVTLQLLTAFLYAIRQIGNEQMTTTILSYLYALPPSSTSEPVEVLKLVLELFGATGIKVGQFTYATQILGEAGEKLQSLQSRARVPDRIEIYEDVYDLLGVPVGTPLPFLVLELLGAASMKYAFMGLDRENLQKVVVKVFRLDAMNNVDLQFDALEHMGKFLVDHYGPRYGVFNVIIKTARTAVRREGSMPNEVRRSRLARHHIYRDRSTEDMHVEAPREDLVNPRMIVAQYANGVPFDQLPDEEKPAFARALLGLENDILFADARVVRFDPDRHAGNAQMDHLGRKRALQPIDFGQILRLDRAQRERIIKLFALAQIASRAGSNPWVLNEFQALLGLSDVQRARLKYHLPRHLRVSTPKPVTYYVSALAALDRSGFAVDDTTYVDLVRGIIQLKPFETWAPDAPSPRKTFTALVFAQIGQYMETFEYDARLRGKIEAFNRFQRAKAWFTGREFELISTDPEEISRTLERQLREENACESALGA